MGLSTDSTPSPVHGVPASTWGPACTCWPHVTRWPTPADVGRGPSRPPHAFTVPTVTSGGAVARRPSYVLTSGPEGHSLTFHGLLSVIPRLCVCLVPRRGKASREPSPTPTPWQALSQQSWELGGVGVASSRAGMGAAHLKMWSRGYVTGLMASGSFSLFSSKMA